MAADPAAAYKARKEAFVSNLTGSSLTDISLVTSVATLAILLWSALQKRQALFTPYTTIAGLADFLLNVGAVLFSFTVYSSAPLALALSLLCPAILMLLLSSQPNTASSKSKNDKKSTAVAATATGKDDSSSPSSSSISTQMPVRPFLTHYRGSMMISTCLAILAVDFPVFPRRFAKVETWGTSLMDLGVGSFVFSAGVVSARAVVKARRRTTTTTIGTVEKLTPGPGFIIRLIHAARHSIPLLILGFIRLWSVKGLDYAEHVTEYGVHWNFFFTLALLPPFVELVDPMARRLSQNYSYDILAVALALAYEIALNNTDLLRYILISPRGPDLLSKNREGVFSLIGYLAIFLAGRGTGVSIVQYQRTSSSSSSSHQSKTRDPVSATAAERRIVLKTLAIRSAIYILLFIVSTHVVLFNLNVSRRLANLSYVLWVASFNATQLLLCGAIESLGPAFSYEFESETAPSDSTLGASSHASAANATSRILRAFNSNGLAIFLVANLLTGLVNLTCNTLDMSVLSAMAVLSLYAAAVAAVAFGLDASGVKIRL
ncbi:hypothetical protein PV10_03430 [Exophiala mesophila]|uniref:GPI-anchored wall transfer protein n=1 Tax=Exophiala mesophila TaxID=212818 RepID=A0A0D1ZPC8_EXOME|nr:uncharacterized protein PV10_03430 [Exophiala mesophila]KIV95824.1 hypothetical protein PV10_03430 [Exophiala mesophila]